MRIKATILKILAAVIAASGLTYAALVYYVHSTGIDMSVHGHVAMALGIFFTFAVGGGLMALLFFSNKHGHDQQVYTAAVGEQDSD